MEYSDNLIPSAETFAQMAKEYTARLRREKLYRTSLSQVEDTLVTDAFIAIKKLISLYSYIKRNIRSTRMKELFLSMEEECRDDLSVLENTFFSDAKDKRTAGQRKPNNFHACLKSAVSGESALLQILLSLLNYQGMEFVVDICNKHLKFIQNLSDI